MDSAALVGTDIERGADLVKALDDAQFPVRSALWLYLSEEREWRLTIATPLVDEAGPRDAYKRIQKVLAKRPEIDLPLQRISVVSPKDPLIQALRKVVHTGEGISAIRLSRNAVNGVYIEDAVLYRVQ
jgi:hypothetical protein